jgi:phosphotransferase system enzyme I (PtsP)
MAANPLEAVCLAGLGFRTLSLPTSAFVGFKKALHNLDCAAIEACLGFGLPSANHSLRNDVRHFAQDHGYLHYLFAIK